MDPDVDGEEGEGTVSHTNVLWTGHANANSRANNDPLTEDDYADLQQ